MVSDDARASEKTSVATRVAFTLVAVVTVLLAALGAIHYTADRAAVRDRLRADAAREVDELVAGLALPLWNFDRPQIDKVIESAMRVPEIASVEVRQPDVTSPTGQSVYLRGRGQNWEIATPASAPSPSGGAIAVERHITASGADVGVVRILVTPKFAQAVLAKDLWALAIRIIVVDVVLLLILWALLRRAILNPLRVIERYASEVSEGHRDPTRLAGAKFHGELARLRNSIERMVAELDGRYAALESSRTFADAVFETVPAYIAIYDRQGQLVRWNVAAEEMTGFTAEEFPGRHLGSAQPPADFKRVAAAIAEVWDKGHCTIEATIPSKSGERIPCYCKGVRMTIGGEQYMLVIAVDIRDRLRAEAMLLESEKMRTVAGLAAGMAHEINNPLAGMLQSAQVVLNRLRPDLSVNRDAADRCDTTVETVDAYLRDRRIPDLLEAIRSAGQRAAEIVKNMLSFSRGSDVAPAAHDLAALLDAAVRFASDEYDAGAASDFRHLRVRREYDPSLPAVVCRATEIQQVVLNLLKNAAQAMEGRAGTNGHEPTIVLRTLRDGPAHVLLEVEDNGPGMPDAVRRRAFEPFFTTKGPQSGSGLGLFVSYCIITRNHGGSISVESAEGTGTRFTIRLPIGRGL